MGKYLSHTETLYSGTAAATGNTQATPKVSKYSEEGTFFLDVTAASGTDETLDVTLQIYDSIGENWHTLATFDQKTTTGTDVGYVEYGLGTKLAVLYTIGGTDPSFTFSVSVLLKDRL